MKKPLRRRHRRMPRKHQFSDLSDRHQHRHVAGIKAIPGGKHAECQSNARPGADNRQVGNLISGSLRALLRRSFENQSDISRHNRFPLAKFAIRPAII
jgi:hypothetical protein